MRVWQPDLIENAFSDAALNPDTWRAALDLVTAQTESRGAILIPVSGGVVPNYPVSEAMNRAAEQYLRDGWHLRDERNHGINRMMREGIVDDLDILEFDNIRKNAYYQEFLAPHQLRWFAGIKIAAGDDIWCLSIQRSISQGPFSRKQKQLLKQMSGRLSTSAAIARALGSAGVAGALDAFTMSGHGVVLINRKGEASQVNSSAEKLLGSDVRIENKRITSFNPNVTAELNRSLHKLMFQSSGGSMNPPIALPRREKRPILAYPARLSAKAANPLSDCQALVIMIDLDSPGREPHASILRTTFRFSGAEAKLAVLMSAGSSLGSAAEQLDIAKETARNQLKSIFSKAGVSRQSQLIALLGKILDIPEHP